MRRVRAVVREQAPGLRVELAFLEFMQPDLRTCAESLLADGAERVVVLPIFVARAGHLKRDVPLLIDELRQQYPAMHFELADAIGEVDSVVQAMAGHALLLAAV